METNTLKCSQSSSFLITILPRGVIPSLIPTPHSVFPGGPSMSLEPPTPPDTHTQTLPHLQGLLYVSSRSGLWFYSVCQLLKESDSLNSAVLRTIGVGQGWAGRVVMCLCMCVLLGWSYVQHETLKNRTWNIWRAFLSNPISVLDNLAVTEEVRGKTSVKISPNDGNFII